MARKETVLLLGTAFLFGSAVAAPFSNPIHDADQCHSCDMWITKWPGPKAQIQTNSTAYKFCSVKCMICTSLRQTDNKSIQQLWVQDTEASDWNKPTGPYIDAKKAWFVIGSSKKATMGQSVAPFKTKEAAKRFQEQYGGKVLRFQDLTQEVLGCRVPKKNPIPIR